MSGKREQIEANGQKRYVTRDPEGRFKTNVSLNRSLSEDDRRNARQTVKPGYGNQGDRHTRRGTK